MEDICKKCGLSDRYVKGKFSYCRPCHCEAQKRYIQRKATGESVEIKRPPNQQLSSMLRDSSHEASKKRCPQGHPYSGSNVRTSSQRGGRNINRKCRACERNRKRVSYGLQPEPNPTRLTELLDS
jgi:hypothetical protein